MCNNGEFHATPDGLCIGHPEGDAVLLSPHGVVLLAAGGDSTSLSWDSVASISLSAPTARVTRPRAFLRRERARWAARRASDPSRVPPAATVTIELVHGQIITMPVTRCQRSPRSQYSAMKMEIFLALLIATSDQRELLSDPRRLASSLPMN